MLVTSLSTLLVVDNNIESRRRLTAELVASIDFDAHILEASTAEEGLALCDPRAVDCVLLNFESLDSFDASALKDYLRHTQHHYRSILLRFGAGHELIAISGPNTDEPNTHLNASGSIGRLIQKIRESIEISNSDEPVNNAHNKWQIKYAKLQSTHQELISSCHVVAHDVKNPLFAARELVALTLEEAGGPLTDMQKELLSTALESCDQMNLLLDDWRDRFEEATND